jgi:hypothetical protein
MRHSAFVFTRTSLLIQSRAVLARPRCYVLRMPCDLNPPFDFDLRSVMKRSLARLLALCVVAFAIQSSFCFAQTNTKPARAAARPVKPETPHLEFVTEYIRELAAVERIRAAGEDEANQDKKDDKLPFAGAIHTCTLFELELGSRVRMLKAMRLNAPFDELIPNITAFYERKILLWRRMGEINSAFIGGPKPGVDYDKVAAEMPQIRAGLEFIDQSLFEATPMVFATLIDMKADSKGHASHLIITKEEKAGLISRLDDSFGAKLDQKNSNYTVGAAQVLKDYLNKDFKCADEPWD